MRGVTKLFPISSQVPAKAVRVYYRSKGAAMQKVINCPSGFVVNAETDDQLVAKAQQHAKEVHQMDLTRDQALAMSKPTQS